MKQVRVIKQVVVNGQDVDEEHTFTADTFPMAIEYAERFAKRNGYKLVKSPAKIAELFVSGYQVACNSNEKVFYVR